LQFERSLLGINRWGIGIIKILVFFKRDWFEFQKNFILYFALLCFFPIILYILLVIPLSRFIITEVRYLNWSAAGIWITCSGMAAFMSTSLRIHKVNHETKQINAILNAPISNINFLSYLLFRGILFGCLQFMFSLIITSALSHEYFGLLNTLLIVVQILPVLLFFSILGIFIGLIISHRMLFLHFFLILFMFISLGMGIFIPIINFPDSYILILNKIPLMTIFNNLQHIITHGQIHWFGYFFSIIISVILFFISLMVSNKIFRKI